MPWPEIVGIVYLIGVPIVVLWKVFWYAYEGDHIGEHPEIIVVAMLSWFLLVVEGVAMLGRWARRRREIVEGIAAKLEGRW